MDDSSSLLPDWLELDDLTMEKIFEEMSFHDRFNASLVCVLDSIFAQFFLNENLIEAKIYHTGLSSMVFVF